MRLRLTETRFVVTKNEITRIASDVSYNECSPLLFQVIAPGIPFIGE